MFILHYNLTLTFPFSNQGINSLTHPLKILSVISQSVTRRVIHSSHKLGLESLCDTQNHHIVLNRGTVQVIQGHMLRYGQSRGVRQLRRFVQYDMPQVGRQRRRFLGVFVHIRYGVGKSLVVLLDNDATVIVVRVDVGIIALSSCLRGNSIVASLTSGWYVLVVVVVVIVVVMSVAIAILVYRRRAVVIALIGRGVVITCTRNFVIALRSFLEMTVPRVGSKVGYVDKVVDPAVNVRHRRLIRGEAPLVVHYKLEGVLAPVKVVNVGKVVSGTVHGNLTGPGVEGTRNVHLTTTVFPTEHRGDGIVVQRQNFDRIQIEGSSVRVSVVVLGFGVMIAR